jgi:hypothetical protein
MEMLVREDRGCSNLDIMGQKGRAAGWSGSGPGSDMSVNGKCETAR